MDGRQRIARCCDYEKIIIILDFLPRRRFCTFGGVLVRKIKVKSRHRLYCNKHRLYKMNLSVPGTSHSRIYSENLE